jgi:hypothetical protein
MNKSGRRISTLAGKKWMVLLALSLSAAGAFATLGDGNKKSTTSSKGILSSRSSVNPGYFTLRSGYDFRGSKVISTDKKYFSINTVVTLQKGNTTYVLPLKKKVLIDNVKIDIGNRQFRK